MSGLADGLRRFDASRNAKLSTCLYYSIRAEIAKEFSLQNRVVGLPRTAQEQLAKVDRAIAAFAKEHHR